MSNDLWRGCFIAESLIDPTILNNYQCFKIRITKTIYELDNEGNRGRWHMYWIKAPQEDFDLFTANMKYNWYGHFWKGNDIIAIFQQKKFKLKLNDKTTWQAAIEFGLSQGIVAEQLDFLTI